jgi:hypothetical protein
VPSKRRFTFNRLHIPEGKALYIHRCEKLKYYKFSEKSSISNFMKIRSLVLNLLHAVGPEKKQTDMAKRVDEVLQIFCCYEHAESYASSTFFILMLCLSEMIG